MGKDEFETFVAALRLDLAQHNETIIREDLRLRMDVLGLPPDRTGELLTLVQEWSVNRFEAITKETLLAALGLEAHSDNPLNHAVPRQNRVIVPDPGLMSDLDDVIARLGGGYVILLGPPGSGKTTMSDLYAAHREARAHLPVCRYFCQRDLNDPYPLGRLTASNFLQVVVSFLHDHYPNLFDGQRRFDYTPQRLNEMLHTLGDHAVRQGGIAVLVVDGLDHVSRAGLAPTESLFSALPATLPSGIAFLVSAQSEGQLPEMLRSPRLSAERHVSLGRFSLPRTREYVTALLAAAGVRDAGWPLLRAEGIEGVHARADGLPLYIRYIVDFWLRDRPWNLDVFLDRFPRIDGDVNRYYATLLPTSGSLETHVVRALAASSFPVTLHQLTTIIGDPQINRFVVTDALATVGHLLERQPNGRIRIFHDSFREFLLRGDDEEARDLRHKMYTYLQRDAAPALAQEHLFEYAVATGDLRVPIDACTREWLERELGDRVPPWVIEINVRHGIDAAVTARDLVSLVRIGFVAFQFAVLNDALDRRLILRTLVQMGDIDAAIRYVWDGDPRSTVAPGPALALSFDLARVDDVHKRIAAGLFRAAGETLRAGDEDGVTQAVGIDYCHAYALLAEDLPGFWRHIVETEARRESAPGGADAPYTTAIIGALVEDHRVDDLAALAAAETDDALRARLLVGEARVRAATGDAPAAIALIGQLAATPLLPPEIARTAALVATDYSLDPTVSATLVQADPLVPPTRIGFPRFGGEDMLATFGEQVRARRYLSRDTELDDLDAILANDGSLPARYGRLLIAASRSVRAGNAVDSLLAQLCRRLENLTLTPQERDSFDAISQCRAIGRDLRRALAVVLRDVARESPDNLPPFFDAIITSLPEHYASAVRDALIESVTDCPSCHQSSRSLLDVAVREHTDTVLEMTPRAEGYLIFAGLAAALGEESWADGLFRLAMRAYMGHGEHKDSQLYYLIEAAGRLAVLAPDGRYRRLAEMAECVEWLHDVTDGDDIRHFPYRLVEAVGELDVRAGLRVADQYMAVNRWYDWGQTCRDLAPLVASHDAELAWALATAGTTLAQRDVEYEVQVRLDVIRTMAQTGNGVGVQVFAAETEVFARRVLAPATATAATAAVAVAQTGGDPGRSWRNAANRPDMIFPVDEAGTVEFEDRAVDRVEIRALLGGTPRDVERVLRGLAVRDFSGLEKDIVASVARSIEGADRAALDALAEAVRVHAARLGSRVLSHLAHRYGSLGDRAKFLEWATVAHGEANAWASEWYGGTLEPFLAIAEYDRGAAQALLYTSLGETYKYRPWQIPASVARLYEALPAIGGGPYIALWDVAAAHAASLFSHLPPRPAAFGWLVAWPEAEDPNWREAVAAYILDLLSCPELPAREAALAAAVRLIEYRANLIVPALAARLASTDLAQVTLAAAALHGGSISHPVATVEALDAIRSATATGKLLIADSAVQTMHEMEDAGVAVEWDGTPQAADLRLRGDQAVALPGSTLILPAPTALPSERQRLSLWSPAWALIDPVARALGVSSATLRRRVLREMDRFGYDMVAATDERRELAQHYRMYGDDVEFEDPHICASMQALSHVVWQVLGESMPGPDAVAVVLSLLRNYDPSLLSRHLNARPEDVGALWDIPDDTTWLAQDDRGDPYGIRTCGDTWMTVFESYQIQEGGRHEDVLRCVGLALPAALGPELQCHMERGESPPLVPLSPNEQIRNLSRLQAKGNLMIMPNFDWWAEGIRPLVTAHFGRWRYGGPYIIAALLRSMSSYLGLEWTDRVSLDMSKDGEPAVLFREWEESYSEAGPAGSVNGRGARLLVRVDLLQQLALRFGGRVASWEGVSRNIRPPRAGREADQGARYQWRVRAITWA